MKIFNSILLIFFILLSYLFAGENYWSYIEGTSIAYVLDIAVDPVNPDIVYFCGYNGEDYNAYKSIDGGLTFQQMTDLPIDNSFLRIAIAPSSPNIIFITLGMFSPASIFKSEDYGTTWVPADSGTATIGCGIAVDPFHPDTVYYAETYPYKSIDGGENWFQSGVGITNYYCYDIVINPINPNILYLCSVMQGIFTGTIYKSINGAETWEEKANGIPWANDIHHLAIDPIHTDTIYASTLQTPPPLVSSIYKSIDGGENWFEIDNGLPNIGSSPPCLAIDPLRPNIVFAGFSWDNETVYRSTNGGESWEQFNVGLPEYEINTLAVTPTTPPTIFAGTGSGQGVWMYTDTTVGIDEQNPEIKLHHNFLHQNYPNPFNPETVISFTLKKQQKVSLTLYDIKGKKVKTIFKGTARKGKTSYTLKSDELSSGIYLYKLKTVTEELVEKCVLMR